MPAKYPNKLLLADSYPVKSNAGLSYNGNSEQYLLNMERKAFVELCGERKTLERIQSLLQTGKILRN